mmetsp:Transcript_38578/g.96612  ORF Transcript_38578/g.96612 Transcript_38578/m.96612 type:complete len:209 (+) Transcript_38578:214-840(+)
MACARQTDTSHHARLTPASAALATSAKKTTDTLMRTASLVAGCDGLLGHGRRPRTFLFLRRVVRSGGCVGGGHDGGSSGRDGSGGRRCCGLHLLSLSGGLLVPELVLGLELLERAVVLPLDIHVEVLLVRRVDEPFGVVCASVEADLVAGVEDAAAAAASVLQLCRLLEHTATVGREHVLDLRLLRRGRHLDAVLGCEGRESHERCRG